MDQSLLYCERLLSEIGVEFQRWREAVDVEARWVALSAIQRKARNIARVCADVKLTLKGVA